MLQFLFSLCVWPPHTYPHTTEVQKYASSSCFAKVNTPLLDFLFCLNPFLFSTTCITSSLH
jgi:hypothetical protein